MWYKLILKFHVRGVLLFCQGIACKSAKKKKGMTVGFVSFESVEQLKGALEVSLLPECHDGCCSIKV